MLCSTHNTVFRRSHNNANYMKDLESVDDREFISDKRDMPFASVNLLQVFRLGKFSDSK